MASAAGGTIQRLKPGPAIVRSRDRNPGAGSAWVVAILFFGYLEVMCVLHQKRVTSLTVAPEGGNRPRSRDSSRRECVPWMVQPGGCRARHEIFMHCTSRCGDWVTQHLAGR